MTRQCRTAADEREPRHPGLIAARSVACAVFVLAAIAVEVMSGPAANSPELAGVARLVPLGWPAAARVRCGCSWPPRRRRHRVLLDRFEGRRR